MGNEKAQAKEGKVSGLRPGGKAVTAKGRHDEAQLPQVRRVLGKKGLSKADMALAAWAKVPKGWPTCVVKGDKVCLLPRGHDGRHLWESTVVGELPQLQDG